MTNAQAERFFRSGQSLADVRITGDVLLTSQVPHLQCLRCCFEDVVQLDNLSIASEAVLDDSEFKSLVSVDKTRFHETFDVKKVGFDKGLFISGTEFGSNARFRAVLVEDDLNLEDILVPGLFELSGSEIHGKTRLEHSTVNIADFRGTAFDGPLNFVNNSHEGATLMYGVNVRKGIQFDLDTLAGGIDLRHAEIGPLSPPHDAAVQRLSTEKQDAFVQIENSYVGGAILLDGSHWYNATLHVNASTFEKIELNDWQTFKKISQPPSGPYASSDIRDRLWNEYLAFLRATEAGYKRDGYADLAKSADLYRIGLEAQRGGLWKLVKYWFLDLSCKNGYELGRILILWLAVIISFAGAFLYYSEKFRIHPRPVLKGRFLHRLHDFSEDILYSALSFFNLERTLGSCYPVKKRKHAIMLMHIERLLGVIILFISAALAGAYLSK
jgi:hypothetical protein